MRKPLITALLIASAVLLASCSPRDYLTRRLAADLIATSDTFRAPQPFQLRSGVVSNQDFLLPDYVMLQHKGWISGTRVVCPQAITPPPCWDVMLTPAGVETFQNVIAPADSGRPVITILAARRQLVAVTGIAKQGTIADVEFTWRWIPLNEVGAVMYPGDVHYRSTARFRFYDDGWRVVLGTSRPGQPFDDALKNADPIQ